MPNLKFLLLQDNTVFDSADEPGQLSLWGIEPFAGFKIVLGYIDEGGEKEILGIAADVAPIGDCVTWRISSVQDGQHRLINSAGCPGRLARRRLHVMFTQGWFDNLCQLPMPVTIVPGR